MFIVFYCSVLVKPLLFKAGFLLSLFNIELQSNPPRTLLILGPIQKIGCFPPTSVLSFIFTCLTVLLCSFSPKLSACFPLCKLTTRLFILFCIILFGRQKKRQIEISHLLVHSPYAVNSWVGAKQKLGTQPEFSLWVAQVLGSQPQHLLPINHKQVLHFSSCFCKVIHAVLWSSL